MEKRVKKSVEGKKITQTVDQILKASTFEHKLQRDLTAKLNQLALVRPQEELDQIESHET